MDSFFVVIILKDNKKRKVLMRKIVKRFVENLSPEVKEWFRDFFIWTFVLWVGLPLSFYILILLYTWLSNTGPM